MDISEDLKGYIIKTLKHKADNLHFITPVLDEVRDLTLDPLKFTYVNDFYYPNGYYKTDDRIGIFPIQGKYFNIGIVPHNKNAKFPDNIVVAKYKLDTIQHTSLTKYLPYIYIRSKEARCYYDIASRSFNYNRNNVILHETSSYNIEKYIESLRKQGFTHLTIVYFSPKKYKNV